MKTFLLAVALAATPAASLAGTVDVPLHIDMRHLQDRVTVSLDRDTEARPRLVAGSCDRVDLVNPQLTTHTRCLKTTLALTARSKVMAFGRCTGPRPVAECFQVRP